MCRRLLTSWRMQADSLADHWRAGRARVAASSPMCRPFPWRPAVSVLATYVVVRLLLVLDVAPGYHPDTPSYQVAPSLFGAHSRPWVVPLIHSTLPDRGVIYFQATLSALAFFCLSCSIASTIYALRIRVVVMAVILLLGTTRRVTDWDTAMLSESIGLSLTALLVAAMCRFRTRLRGLRAIAVSAVFCVWIFARDGHLYLGVIVLVIFVIAGLRSRAILLPALMLMSLLWALLAAHNNDEIEGYNVAVNVAWHVIPSDGRYAWFVEHGMPPVPHVRRADPSPGAFGVRVDALTSDDRFWHWATGRGPATYLRFIATHPQFAGQGLAGLLHPSLAPPQALVDHTAIRITSAPVSVAGALWPMDGVPMAVVLTLAAVLGGLVATRSQRTDERWLIPTFLAASTAPHALLAWHSSPWEPARHGVVLSFVLVVADWWLIALALDFQGVDGVERA